METTSSPSWLDRPISFFSHWTVEKTLIAVILFLAVLSRFYDVGARVMSHDEVNHVVPSFELSQGRGYRHDPVTHGPFQFHIVALSYFLFGDSDFSSRIPAALFSTAAVAFVLFGFRRYLGKVGAMVAGVLFLISPYMLFYGRYTRNEAFIELFGAVMLYAVLRYLERGDRFALILLTLSIVMHVCSKETSFIYIAQILAFLAILFLEQVIRTKWEKPDNKKIFVTLISIALVLFMVGFGMAIINASQTATAETPAAEGPAPTAVPIAPDPLKYAEIAGVIGAIAVAGFAIYVLIRSVGWEAIRKQRSFDMLILIGTLVLPLLAAFPIKMIGFDPLDYALPGLIRSGIVLAVIAVISTAIGIWWERRFWLINAAIFYGIFTVLYTTFFTNGQGFFSGLIGSLGYWLSQQGVERGSQPLYFYALIQVPIYEFLGALGTLLAVYYGIRYRLFSQPVDLPPAEAIDQPRSIELDKATSEDSDLMPSSAGLSAPPMELPGRLPVLSLLAYWSITALAAYSIAGEKMPWLTVHIALPLLLCAGWGLGILIERVPWKRLLSTRGVVALLLLPVIVTSLSGVMGGLLGAQRPFAGNTLEQLLATNNFLISSVVFLASLIGLVFLLGEWQFGAIFNLFGVAFFALLAVITVRAAYRANYINYDYATEYLVYAHAGPGPKEVLQQVEEISQRISGNKDIVVAYDADGLYPYWWYFRDYPNHRWYGEKPTRDLRDAPLIIAGETTLSKMDPVVQDNYVMYEYIRLWWPNQDYFNLTWDRLWGAVSNPVMRAAIFDIWLNRDYTAYAQATGSDALTLATWEPSSKMRFYIRKDVIAQIWNYGVAPSAPTVTETDPYVAGLRELIPMTQIGQPGELNGPRGVAAAPDGSIYVSDARNNRIMHYSAEGELIHNWGSPADAAREDAPGGTFNEPWGIAVSPDGNRIYVADTWNHRVQVFSKDGQFIQMWGYFGQAESADAFWGPRDVAVDADGRVYVTDTGNKRVVIFTPDGTFITQFGSAGLELGQFDEPVGLAIGPDNLVYVADTWNQRVQVFQPDQTGINYQAIREWEIFGWNGQSLENKPFIEVSADNRVFVSDPETPRVLEFDSNGLFLKGWGEYSVDSPAISIYNGIAVDPDGAVWVTDSVNNTVVRFVPE